jgi:solute:Na+ symporter, SSS family
METLDYSVVVGYLVMLLVVGFVLARKAAGGADDYFLGGRRIPWWALGASGMSSNLDAAGTMTIVALVYMYGLHGLFIEMRGGVVLPIAVFLAFMGKWHRRSEVMTTAEWMELRFGAGRWGRAARYAAAGTYLVITVGMVVFFLAAAGKFLAVFLPFGPTTCAVGMALIALIYTMVSGLYGVVWTDVFQAALIGAAAIYVAVRGALLVEPGLLEAWPGAAFNSVIPRLTDPALGEYELFAVFLLAWVGKGLLEGLGGSGGSAYMAQRFYAAPDEPACRKLSMLWTLLFACRWPMVLGFAIIAVSLGVGTEDPERILPQVLASEFFPTGVRGLVVAAIFAASMSTFDSTINAGASYVVRDLVSPLWPHATQKQLVAVGYGASVLIVALGLGLALGTSASVVDIWVAIVIQLFPAFLVPFALRWYWSRFNGAGFTAGIAAGFAASSALFFAGDSVRLNEIATLGTVAGISFLGCLAGTYLTAQVPGHVLQEFYERIRPFGLWPKPWCAPHAEEHHRDGLRLAAALPWQLATFLLPMLAVLHMWGAVGVLGVLWLALGAWLWKTSGRP